MGVRKASAWHLSAMPMARGYGVYPCEAWRRINADGVSRDEAETVETTTNEHSAIPMLVCATSRSQSCGLVVTFRALLSCSFLTPTLKVSNILV